MTAPSYPENDMIALIRHVCFALPMVLTSTPFRGIWTPRDNGDVVQRFEIWNAESNEWSVWFEGLYVKQ